ncbi:MAG: ABC transporter permease subunit, partial [Deltaproteobacteria bacterium]
MEWDWTFVIEILPKLIDGVVITIQASILGSLVAMILGLALAILRRSQRRIIRSIVYWFLEFVRGTPLLVQLYFLFYVLPDVGIVLSPMATGVIGLGLHYSAYTAEVYRAG